MPTFGSSNIQRLRWNNIRNMNNNNLHNMHIERHGQHVQKLHQQYARNTARIFIADTHEPTRLNAAGGKH